MFQHKLLPRLTIPTKMNGDKRIYVTPEGNFLSVTTILKKHFGSKALDDWRERIGEDSANQIAQSAKVRGNAIHKIAESFLMNKEDWSSNVMPTNLHLFNTIKKILQNNISLVYGCELPIYSTYLRCGGCTDLAARWGKYRSIIDFKTSLRLKSEKWIESYFLQMTAYSIMMEERYGFAFPQIIVIILVDHEEPQIFIKMRTEFQQKVVGIFKN